MDSTDSTDIHFSTQESSDGRAHSMCTITREDGFVLYKVNTKKPMFPTCVILLFAKSKNQESCSQGPTQEFMAYLIFAETEQLFEMILSKVRNTEQGSRRLPGSSDAAANNNHQFIISIKKHTKIRVFIKKGDTIAVATAIDDDEEEEEEEKEEAEFFVRYKGQNYFSEEELKTPNNTLKGLSFPEQQRLKLDELHPPTFGFEIIWHNTESPEVTIDVVIEVETYNDHERDSASKASFNYPVVFTNLAVPTGARLSVQDKKNRKASEQLSMSFQKVKDKLEEIDSIIQFLCEDGVLDAQVKENISQSREKKGELLRYVTACPDAMPSFLQALVSTRNQCNLEVWELIKKKKK